MLTLLVILVACSLLFGIGATLRAVFCIAAFLCCVGVFLAMALFTGRG